MGVGGKAPVAAKARSSVSRYQRQYSVEIQFQNDILLVDARNPQSPKASTVNTTDILRNVFAVAPNYLYALIENTGLAVYQISN